MVLVFQMPPHTSMPNSYTQGKSRTKGSGVSSATALGAHSIPSQNHEKLAIHFDSDAIFHV